MIKYCSACCRHGTNCFGALFGEAIVIETIGAGMGLWNTIVDPVNLENAIVNLKDNARDAMDGIGGN